VRVIDKPVRFEMVRVVDGPDQVENVRVVGGPVRAETVRVSQNSVGRERVGLTPKIYKFILILFLLVLKGVNIILYILNSNSIDNYTNRTHYGISKEFLKSNSNSISNSISYSNSISFRETNAP